MSHFLTIVLVGREHAADLDHHVSDVLDTYFEYSERCRVPKFDGCTIGGRYDAQVFGAPPEYDLSPAEFQQRYGPDVVRTADNVRPASEVPEGLVPYALVTPDGRWRDCEGKAWEDWAAEARELLSRYGDQLAVVVDCHT